MYEELERLGCQIIIISSATVRFLISSHTLNCQFRYVSFCISSALARAARAPRAACAKRAQQPLSRRARRETAAIDDAWRAGDVMKQQTSR